MRIEQLFKKDIFRPINGVVKADQLDAESVWQELDEFVVTRELSRHFERFFSRYRKALDAPNDAEVRNETGVWVSGFFGSGKSHFIKVLSYLLANDEHSGEGETRRAIEFFESKIDDPMLYGDMKRAVASGTDVILFNIDSKADSRAGREAILAVFLRVLNEMQGFSGDHAHIAHMERYLAGRGQLETFHDTYRELTDTEWVHERDAYQFNRDQVVEALSRTLDQSAESCEKWIDGAEETFALTVENFAKWAQEYLDSKGPNHRIVFLADEVGQFIGTDTHLMLNLQTIAEELGTICGGRVWVVVTSQEDIDAVLGEIGTSRANDFSKIQGRFKTRLSLSSANVDEVIRERLLSKRDEPAAELERIFAKKGDVIKHQLTFKNVGMTFKQVKGADEFVQDYPFAPYQFQLLQKIFESIRKAGATGLHLAQGERSLLDAFQSAAKAVASREIGVAVPLYLFYPSIESFLDTGVKRTIDHARENPSLEPFDAHVLEVLFLIRYVDEMKGNLDNLVTLCLDEIDADRLTLRRKIEESLQRLEQDSLISRSGDNFFFLTNEERDINREIKSVEIGAGEEPKLLGELIFTDILREQRKHRFTENKMDFAFNRFCDLHPVGNRLDGALSVSVVTPLNDEYGDYKDSRCILESTQDQGQVLIRLPDHQSLGRELRTYLKTEKYLRTKDDGTLAQTTRRVHRDLADDNRTRRERLIEILRDLLTDGRYFAAGQPLTIKGTTPMTALEESVDYLIRNTFGKMSYLKHLTENPLPEIQAILRSDDVGQGTIGTNLPTKNPQAIDELRQHIELANKASKQLVLSELIHKKYSTRPYGWPPLEIVLLLARLYAAGEIRFQMAGALLHREQVYDAITTQSKWPKVVIHLRETTRPEDLQEARQLGKEVFAEMGPDAEEGLYDFLREKCETWKSSLSSYKSLAETGYPGLDEIEEGLSTLGALLACRESNKFLPRFLERRDELLGLADAFHDLDHFYRHQRPTWERLREALAKFETNRAELEQDESARAALKRIQEIVDARAPYGMINETQNLIDTVSEVNQRLVSEAREEALYQIDQQVQLMRDELELAHADDQLADRALRGLLDLRGRVQSQGSMAHLERSASQAVALKDAAMVTIQDAVIQRQKQAGADEVKEAVPKPPTVIRPASLVKKPYLERDEDAKEFLQQLEKQLEEGLRESGRVEIR